MTAATQSLIAEMIPLSKIVGSPENERRFFEPNALKETAGNPVTTDVKRGRGRPRKEEVQP